MSETVESKLGVLAKRQGHPGSINIADVGHMMKSWKQTKDDLERQLEEAQAEIVRLKGLAAYYPTWLPQGESE